MKGLSNLIKLYHPDVIGVATTCLAETIGEDVPAILREFQETHPDEHVKLISVSSAGYGGTQYEGFMRALRALVSQVDMDNTPNGRINIVTPMLSPADTRLLKELLELLGVSYILLPDLSDNLDGVHVESYERLKSGGTSLADIAAMAGARHTIELSLFVDEKDSPAAYLYETCGVPYTRMALPVGIRDTDAFIGKIVSLGGTVPEALIRERGRYIDAMVDAHKYCADARAAVFGEPDLVYAMTRLCCELGTVPVAVATGSVCPALKPMLEEEVRAAAERLFVTMTAILDDCDFDLLEERCRTLGANLMIGSSDGRRAAHRLGIPLVRCAFPVHDRIGGQRVLTLGYEGSLSLMDQIANELLGRKEESFREELYDRYFEKEAPPAARSPAEIVRIPDLAEKTRTHPCFTCGGGKICAHPSARRPGLQHPVQLLRPKIRLPERKPPRRHDERALAAGSAGTLSAGKEPYGEPQRRRHRGAGRRAGRLRSDEGDAAAHPGGRPGGDLLPVHQRTDAAALRTGAHRARRVPRHGHGQRRRSGNRREDIQPHRLYGRAL
jgi:nitrogenase molybdenum-iron protein alpha/beta subunit